MENWIFWDPFATLGLVEGEYKWGMLFFLLDVNISESVRMMIRFYHCIRGTQQVEWVKGVFGSA